jgi:hypothetical protein
VQPVHLEHNTAISSPFLWGEMFYSVKSLVAHLVGSCWCSLKKTSKVQSPSPPIIELSKKIVLFEIEHIGNKKLMYTMGSKPNMQIKEYTTGHLAYTNF